jgi:hypothetical protein
MNDLKKELDIVSINTFIIKHILHVQFLLKLDFLSEYHILNTYESRTYGI